MSVLAVIPARAGSKGLPRKNRRPFVGRPLIEWTISAARSAGSLAHVVVSTDDPVIAEIARNADADVVDRPAEMAQDTSPVAPLMAHALACCETRGLGPFQYLMVLQPTSPLRTAQDIDAAVHVLQDSGADSLVSVYPLPGLYPEKMYRLDGAELEPVIPSNAPARRQDLGVIYHRNGAIFACTRSFFQSTGALWGGRMVAHPMPIERSVDIDTADDFTRAEAWLIRQQST